MPLAGDAPRESTPLQWLWRVVRVGILVWLGLLLYLALAQRSMIYFPSHLDEAAAAAIAAEQGLEPWRDGARRVIGLKKLAPSADRRPRAAVLVVHGNGGQAVHRRNYAKLPQAAPGRALSVYLLEYPGYGARDGTPSQDALIAAAREAVALIPADEPLIVLGESLGTGVAAALAAAAPERVTGLLLVTPFDSLASVAQHHYPLLPVRWIMRDRYPAAEWLVDYRGPAVFLLAGADDVVPAKFGETLFDGYTGPKSKMVVEAAGHNDVTELLTTDQWREALGFVLP